MSYRTNRPVRLESYPKPAKWERYGRSGFVLERLNVPQHDTYAVGFWDERYSYGYEGDVEFKRPIGFVSPRRGAPAS